PPPAGSRPLASPSVRARAREEGIDLRRVAGSGPGGRISHDDLENWTDAGDSGPSGGSRRANTGIEEVRVIGMRRKIAEKMAQAKRHIPHITIVEEVEMDALEDLRAALNRKQADGRPKLTLLPFLMRAIVEAVREQPEMNAIYDDEAGVIHRHGGVHVGIATQTPQGLTVPVVRHAEASGLWDNAAEVARLADAARDGSIKLEELGGGTITITSLGPLGAIATTPIINYPQVAIVGVNKMQIRPAWDGQQFRPRRMMNISCSFDHRVIDGWDAAVFVQKLKALMETPALLFVEG
ncbi:dihydrolipoamide acetyltransferase family protein, partial [Nitratireductor pacificus]